MRNPLLSLRLLVNQIRLVKDPRRLGEVLAIADGVARSRPDIMQSIASHLSRDPQGRSALRDRPRLGPIDLEELRSLPEGSLGREFAEHMVANGLDPAALPQQPADDPLTYLHAHLVETHDIWHVATGFGTDVAGELGLQAFYLAQFPSRLALLLISGGLINSLIYAFEDREQRMDAIVRGWQLGKRSAPLFGMRWNTLWSIPLSELRRQLGLEIEPAQQATLAA